MNTLIIKNLAAKTVEHHNEAEEIYVRVKGLIHAADMLLSEIDGAADRNEDDIESAKAVISTAHEMVYKLGDSLFETGQTVGALRYEISEESKEE